MHMMKSAAMDGDKIPEADIGSVHEVSLVEHAVEKDENHDHIQRMEFMMEKILIQQKMSDQLNLKLYFVYKEMTRKIEALDTHVITLDTQVSQTTEAMKIQEALVKGKAVESERYQVDDILNNDFGKVDEHEKLEEEPFLVESSMSIGSSHWCRLTPSAEHQSTFLAEHRSTLSFGHRSTPTEEYVGIVRIQRHSEFSARHPHPPIPYSFKTDDINRHYHDVIDRQQERSTERHQQASSDKQLPMTCQVRLLDLEAHRLNATWNPFQTSFCLRTAEKTNQQPAYAPGQEQLTLAETCFVESVDRRHQPSVGRHQMDGHEPVMERQATKERISTEKRMKSRKPYIPNHLRREVQNVKFNGFHKRVKRVPKDMSFEVAFHKYRHGNLFLESRETDKYIELLCNKVSCKPKRALKNEQDPGKFLIPCCIHSHNFPNALYWICSQHHGHRYC